MKFAPETIDIEETRIEQFYEYLHLKNILDASFFQSLLVKMTSNPANTEPVNFLVGRKIRQEEYILEHHQVRYCAYAQRLATPMEHFFTGGDEKYREHFDNLPYLSQITSVDILQKTVAKELDGLIQYYDQQSEYNPVGKPVKSYVLR